MKQFSSVLLIAVAIMGPACSIDEADRCDPSQVYESGYCVIPDTEAPDNPYKDSGVTGLGEVCTSPGDCEDLDADYCAMSPGAASGNCTVQNCTAVPEDTCPADMICCVLDAGTGMPPLCMSPDKYNTYKGLGVCP
jgi:hypothetical protein